VTPMVRMRVLKPDLSTSGRTGRPVRIEVPKLLSSFREPVTRYCMCQIGARPWLRAPRPTDFRCGQLSSRRTLKGSPAGREEDG